MEIWVANADGSGARTAHQQRRPGHGAHLEPHRPGDRLHLRPGGHAADLRDGQRGAERPPAHDDRQLERRARLEPVQGVQRDRLHRAPRGRLRDRGARPGHARRSGRSPQGRGSCEYPSWAPSGRHLAFACERGGNVADHGGRPRRARASPRCPPGAGNNVQPDWGPVTMDASCNDGHAKTAACCRTALAPGRCSLGGLRRQEAAAGVGGEPARPRRAPPSPSDVPSGARTRARTCSRCGRSRPRGDGLRDLRPETGEGGPLADIHFELRPGRPHRRGRAASSRNTPLWLQSHRDGQGHRRGPLRRARHRRVQPRPGRAARAAPRGTTW